MPTIKEVIERSEEELKETSDTPRLDSQLLLASVFGKDRTFIISQSDRAVESDRLTRFEELLARRRKGEPIAYLRGFQEFWGLQFEVNSSVLIPRPETELLVGKSLGLFDSIPQPASILDLGTGSGCIAVSLGYELNRAGKEYSITALDHSREALQTARRNAARHEIAVTFEKSEWFESLPRKRFSLIVSNPPYVSLGSTDVSAETKFEPSDALYAGEDGLDAIRHLLDAVPEHLKEGGALLMEFGFEQREAIEEYLSRNEYYLGKQIDFIADLNGIDRVLSVTA